MDQNHSLKMTLKGAKSPRDYFHIRYYPQAVDKCRRIGEVIITMHMIALFSDLIVLVFPSLVVAGGKEQVGAAVSQSIAAEAPTST